MTPLLVTLLASTAIAGPAGPQPPAVVYDDPTLFETVGAWTAADLGLTSHLGALRFTSDGTQLYVINRSEFPDSAAYVLDVVRDPLTERVIGFGPPTLLFTGNPSISGGLDVGFAFGPEGTLFTTYYIGNHLAQRPGGVTGPETVYDLAPLGIPTSVGGLDFSPHHTDPLTGFGQLLLSTYPGQTVWELSLTPAGGGLFTPTAANPYVVLPTSGAGAIQFIGSGDFAGQLMYVNWSASEFHIVEVDPATGYPIDALTGLPTLGTTNPVDTRFASNIARAWGLTFDPIAGDFFVSTWGISPDWLIQIGGAGFNPDLDSDGYADVAVGGDDCDDENPNVNPGAAEVPGNPIDEDCDGSVDCYVDDDGDGVGIDQIVVDVDGDGSCTSAGEASGSGDCDDTDPSISPDLAEIPGNDIDEDCDGTVSCYEDFDTDGVGSDVVIADLDGDLACTSRGEALVAGDCDDLDGTAAPGLVEVPGNDVDEDCDGDIDCFVDLDEDGFGGSAIIRDLDGDGACVGLGEATEDTDCDDTNAALNPVAGCVLDTGDSDADTGDSDADTGDSGDDTDDTDLPQADSADTDESDAPDTGVGDTEVVDTDSETDEPETDQPGDTDDSDPVMETDEPETDQPGDTDDSDPVIDDTEIFDDPDDKPSSSCGCASTGGGGGTAFGLLMLLGLRRRRG